MTAWSVILQQFGTNSVYTFRSVRRCKTMIPRMLRVLVCPWPNGLQYTTHRLRPLPSADFLLHGKLRFTIRMPRRNDSRCSGSVPSTGRSERRPCHWKRAVVHRALPPKYLSALHICLPLICKYLSSIHSSCSSQHLNHSFLKWEQVFSIV